MAQDEKNKSAFMIFGGHPVMEKISSREGF